MFHRLQPLPVSVILFIIIAPISIVFYGAYIFDPKNIGFVPLYLLQIIADMITIAIAGSLWLTLLLDIIQPEHHKRKLSSNRTWIDKNLVTVDVLVPVLNEPTDIIENTLASAVAMDYPHKTFVLDDGNSEEIKQLAKKLGVEYVTRPKEGRRFAKAGNLNNGLQFCHGEFFAVFDADFAPKKEFLIELMPFFQNESVALVQSPQSYGNTDNFIASGTAQAQEIFYKYVLPAKNSYNAAFCVGTNMIYRRSAINEIGGVAKLDHSEDIWTTILLHEHKYESVFYHKILAIGRAPDTISAFFRQQNRWAQGGFSLMFTRNPLFSSSLTLDQKLQYFLSNIFFLSGFSVLIYLLLPIIYLLFGVHPMKLQSTGWALHYIPFFITMYVVPLSLVGMPKLSTMSVALSSFYPYIGAFFDTLFQSKYIWVPTEMRRKVPTLLASHLWPHLLIVMLSVTALIIGWYNSPDTVTTVATSIWVAINAYILLAFIKYGILTY